MIEEKVVWISDMVGPEGKQVRTWRSGGRIMRTNPDSRQQPKSLAQRLLQKRSDWIKFGWGDPVVTVRPNKGSCRFIRFGRGGSKVFNGGRSIGTIMPSPSDAVLAASPGIQSWSRSGAGNSPTDGHFERG